MPGPMSIPNGNISDPNNRLGGAERAELAQSKKLNTGKTRVVKKIDPRWDDPSRRPRKMFRD